MHSELFQQITTALDGCAQAWKTNDGAELGRHYTEDGSLVNPFGERADGRAALTAMYTEYFGGMLRGTTTSFEVARARPVGVDHAFVDARQVIRAPDGSTVLALHLAALMRREGGTWRLVDARPFSYATPGAPA